MQKRNPIAVALLSLITFGIYALYWTVKTKGEMNAKGANIPTAWIIIVPLAQIWWYWKYCEGVSQVTKKKVDPAIPFILIMLISPVGYAVIQDYFNKYA